MFQEGSYCQYSMAEENPEAQKQTAVTAYFSSKQLLLFVFARRPVCQYSMAEENHAAQRQPSKHDALTQCWFYAGPASQTVVRHKTSIGPMRRVCWETAVTV